MKISQIGFIVLSLIISLSATFTVSGDPGDPGGPEGLGDPFQDPPLNSSGSPEITRVPFILSSFQGGDQTLRLWSSPGSSPSILFDNWTFYLFGSPGDPVKIKINGFERFNGSMEEQVLNWSVLLPGLNQARVKVEIGNRSYKWDFLIIQHQALNWDQGQGARRSGSYGDRDLVKATWKGALGVLFMIIPSMWISHSALKYYKNKQGVKEI